MSFRKFVNLVSRDSMKSIYALRRIDISGLFLQTTTNGGRSSPVKKDDRCLPEPVVNFFSSHLPGDCGDMAFMHLENKVVVTDTTGGACLYDPDKEGVRPLPGHQRLKYSVVSHAIGNNLYVIDRLTTGSGTRAFEALVFTPSLHGRWHWQTLPPPPPPPGVLYDPTSINSFATVDAEGSKIWVSTRGIGDIKGCTHLFHAEKLAWSEQPAEWVLPFSGSAEYVPELNKLWFGISSREHGRFFGAADLSTASSMSKSQPPALLTSLKDDTAATESGGWDLVSARAIYLGSGKFCVAKIFAVPMRILEEKYPNQFAVMAGVEVEVTTSSDGGKQVTLVEHNSERYVMDDDDAHWVL